MAITFLTNDDKTILDRQITQLSEDKAVLAWQKAAVTDGFSMAVDGLWGQECIDIATKAIVKKRLLYKYKNLTKIVQRAVGVSDDGKCGPKTVEAIKTYQLMHGLTPDSQVGLNTWKKILGVS